jgi:hypothetical protein
MRRLAGNEPTIFSRVLWRLADSPLHAVPLNLGRDGDVSSAAFAWDPHPAPPRGATPRPESQLERFPSGANGRIS